MSDIRVGSIVINCGEFPRMLEFWQEALHYVPREPSDGWWVVLRDPAGRGPNVSLQRLALPLSEKPRLHLDLYTSDRDGEVERLLALGATLHPRITSPDEDFTVLADPDGNLFCVVEK